MALSNSYCHAFKKTFNDNDIPRKDNCHACIHNLGSQSRTTTSSCEIVGRCGPFAGRRKNMSRPGPGRQSWTSIRLFRAELLRLREVLSVLRAALNPVLLSILTDSLARSSIKHLRVNSRCLIGLTDQVLSSCPAVAC